MKLDYSWLFKENQEQTRIAGFIFRQKKKKKVNACSISKLFSHLKKSLMIYPKSP